MAFSTLKNSCTEQGIFASIDEEVRKKIISTIISTHEKLPLQDGESGFVHFWAAKENGSINLLTTRDQPFLVFGNNKELQEYHQALLDHTLYVFRDDKKEAAFGFAGGVFLYCTPVQTQDVHRYNPTDHRPWCENANIFYRKWGSFAVPVFHGNKCVGVLEFIMDAPRDYTMYISLVQALLEHVGLQTSIPIDSKKRTYIKPEKRSRKTYTSSITWYGCLAPLFGLSSARAAEILATLIKRKIPPSTFTNICRNAGIPEWPCIRNTTVRASSVPEIQINETISEASSSIGAPFPGLISTSDYGYPGHSLPNSMAEFGGMKDQDNGKLVNVDHPDTDMISNGDYVFPEHSPPNSMADFAGMKDQDNNARVMHLDSMDDEKSVNTYCPNADMISNGEYQYSEWSYLTGDFEPCICWTCQGMEYKGDNNPILEDLIEGQMNIDNMR